MRDLFRHKRAPKLPLHLLAAITGLVLLVPMFVHIWQSRMGRGLITWTPVRRHRQTPQSGSSDPPISGTAASWMLETARTAIGDSRVALPNAIQPGPAEVRRKRDTVLFLTLYGRVPPGPGPAGQSDDSVIDRLPNEKASRTQGVGASLQEATANAASAMRAVTLQRGRELNQSSSRRARIKLDVLAGEPELLNKPTDDSGDTAEELIDPGFDGIEIDTGKAKFYLMPSDLIYDSIVASNSASQDSADLLDRTMTAAGLPKDAWQSAATKLYRFQTASFIEDSDHSRALPLVCGFVPDPDITPARLIAAARSGGDYLVRIQKASGQYEYLYDALLDGFPGDHYNIIRHAGTAVSLFDLYRATKDRRYLLSAVHAVDYLKTRFQPAPASLEPGPGPAEADSASPTKKSSSSGPGAPAIYVLDYDGKSRLGANGLALLALTREMRLAPRHGDASAAKGLAKAIIAMQRPDGSLDMYYRAGDDDEEGYSLYYPGEAMLGLIEVYRLSPDPKLLVAVTRGADYLISSQRHLASLPPDAWFEQTLEVLHGINGSRKYSDHAIDLALSMIKEQYTSAAPAGFEGAISPGIPRSTPAGSRAEGNLAAYRLARSLGDERAPQILSAIKSSAAFQISQQFNAENSFFLPDPTRAAGGFHESIVSMRVRIDYVQHNISSLLGLAELIN
jgi:AMMECR1 domain-containing protein